jgi:hypothetical protein
LHPRKPRFRGTALAIAVALLVAACSSGAGGGASGATIGFATPANGAQVTIPFDVRIDSSVALGQPETGNHHAHLYFDTGTDAADYDIVYGNSWQVTRALAPGQHTIIVALANPDHSLAGPTQTITVTVGGAAGSGEPSGSGGAPASGGDVGSPPPSVAPSGPTY